MPFEHYIQKGSQNLRMGFTTGSCAALAAKAAALMLLSGEGAENVSIITPKGLTVEVPVLETELAADYAGCAVQKDAGDDPDITDGALIYAKVYKINTAGIGIDGGIGIGRVTRKGLDQPIGAAAINRVPRLMIEKAVREICELYDYEDGLKVIISIPKGVALAKRTFNPKLGIEGGISVLGTSGIVEPQSIQALIDCIGIEMRALAAEGKRSIVITPGNYGEAFIKANPFLVNAPTVKCANYIGDALDFAVANSFQNILLVGHIGKLVKLAGGIMNTHSAVADCRMELMALHAALAGADKKILAELLASISTDAGLEILANCGLREAVLLSLTQSLQNHLERRVGGTVKVGAVLFSNVYGKLGQTETAAALIDFFK